jgi:hypothetical protein
MILLVVREYMMNDSSLDIEMIVLLVELNIKEYMKDEWY